jgi:hypothetical protein
LVEKYFDLSSLHSCTYITSKGGHSGRGKKKCLAVLAIYDRVKVVGAQGVNIGLEGVSRLLRHFLRKDDYLAFFRSAKHDIRLPIGPAEEVS